MTMTGRPLSAMISFRALYAQRLPSYQLADYRVTAPANPPRSSRNSPPGIVASGETNRISSLRNLSPERE